MRKKGGHNPLAAGMATKALPAYRSSHHRKLSLQVSFFEKNSLFDEKIIK